MSTITSDLNDIEWIKQQLEQLFPQATFDYRPLGEQGQPPKNAWLTTTLGDKSMEIEWRPDIGFGFDHERKEGEEEKVYGEGPDEVVSTKEVVLAKIIERLRK
jgi:hypothetical protein